MIFKNICIHVRCKKVASALEGLRDEWVSIGEKRQYLTSSLVHLDLYYTDIAHSPKTDLVSKMFAFG